MPLRIECPNCQATLEIPENALGKQVQCPSCTGLISVAGEPEPETSEEKKGKKAGKGKGKRRREEEERRLAREKAKQFRLWLFIGIGVLVLIAIVGASLLIRRTVIKAQDDPRVNGENFDLLTRGLSLAEVEKILGSGHEASSSEVKEVITSDPPPDNPGTFEQGAASRTAYIWKNGKARILIVFDGPPKTGGKTMASHFVAAVGDAPPKR